MTNIEATLFGAGMGGIIGVIGTYIGAVKIMDRQLLLDAGRRLRESFQTELAILCANKEKIDAFFLLDRAFQKHAMAVNEFKYILRGNKCNSFDQAWQEYHCTNSGDGNLIHFLEQYNTIGVSVEERVKNRELAITRIGNILSFTVK